MSAKSLFVNNLHYDVSEEMLKKKFSVAGEVIDIELKKKTKSMLCICLF